MVDEVVLIMHYFIQHSRQCPGGSPGGVHLGQRDGLSWGKGGPS
jgi:hypothetical protein